MASRHVKNIVIIGYNRLNYWTQCIEGIRSSVDTIGFDHKDITFHAFLDGPQSLEVEKSADIFRETFEGCHTKITLQNDNLGSDKHIHYALENSIDTSINKMNEDYLIVEDDVILNSNSLLNLNAMMERFRDNGRIGSFQLWNENPGSFNGEIMPVESTQSHWWGYTLDVLTYRTIQPFLMKYFDLVKDLPQKNRPNQKIYDLFKPVLDSYESWIDTTDFSDWQIAPNEIEFQRVKKAPAMSQDMAMAVALMNARLLKVAPYYAICSNVGKIGAHMSPGIHERITSGINEVDYPVKFQ